MPYDPDEDFVYIDEDDDNEWQPNQGECDNCSGSTAQELSRASLPNASSPFTPVCACAIGQGAPAEECVCG